MVTDLGLRTEDAEALIGVIETDLGLLRTRPQVPHQRLVFDQRHQQTRIRRTTVIRIG